MSEYHFKAREPTYGEKANAIIHFIENPCFDPWMGILELAVPPAGHAVLTLIEPSLSDIVRGFARPKGARFGGHSRHRRKKRTRWHLPEDTSEIIAKRIPGYKTMRNRVVTDGVKIMWAIDGIIQRAFWYWLVADVTLEFFYEWTSAIMQSEYCSHSGAGSGAYIAGKSATIQNTRKGLTQGIVLYRTGGAIITDRGSYGSITGNFSGGAGCTTYASTDYPPTFATRLVLVDGGDNIVAAGNWKTHEPGQEKNGHILTYSGPQFAGCTPYIESSAGQGIMYIDDCQANVGVSE